MMKRFLLVLVLILPLFIGCNPDKATAPSPDETKGPGNLTGDTVYIALNPAWEGFNNPKAIFIGEDNFIYVCDTDNNRIVMLNEAGVVLGTREIQHPIAMSQDQKRNLIVCAEFDTTLNGVTSTISAVYKINMVAALHHIDIAPIKRVLPKNFEFPERRYTAVTTFYDNSYYVARTGPNNSSVYDPDNAILPLAPNDSLISLRVPNIDALSTGLISANGINSMTSFRKKNFDFIATFNGESAFKAQWFNFYSTIVSEGYKSKYVPNDGVAFAQPDRFLTPGGSCIDDEGHIFVADAIKDSVFKFDAFGEELHSFGGLSVFSKPSGVAHYNKTLYVLDAEKNQVLRFILSTDTR